MGTDEFGTQKAGGGSGQCVSPTFLSTKHVKSVDSSSHSSEMPATWCSGYVHTVVFK